MTSRDATSDVPDYANWLRALALEEVCPNSLKTVTPYEFSAVKRLEEFGAKVLEKWALTTSYGSARSETACRDSVIEECAKKCEWYAGTLDNEYNRKNFGKIQDLQEPYYEMAEQLRALKNAAPQVPVSASLGIDTSTVDTPAVAAPVSAPSAIAQKEIVPTKEQLRMVYDFWNKYADDFGIPTPTRDDMLDLMQAWAK